MTATVPGLPARPDGAPPASGTAPEPTPPAPPAAPVVRGRRLLALSVYVRFALAALSGPLLARALGPAGRGVVAAVFAFDDVSTRAASFALPEASGYFAASGRRTPAQLLGLALRWSLALTPLMVVVAWLVARGPLGDVPTSGQVAGFLFIATSPFTTVALVARHLLVAQGRLVPVAVHAVLPFAVVCAVVGALHGLHRVSLVAALATYIGAKAVAQLYLVWTGRTRPARPEGAGEVLRYAARAFPGTLSDFLNTRLDQLMLLPLVGASDLGLYAVAANYAMVAIGLAQASALHALPVVAGARPDERADRVRELLWRTAWTTTAVTAVLAVAAAWALPTLFGEAFRDSTGAALVLLAGAVPWAVFLTGNACLQATGRPSPGSVAQVVAVAVTALGIALVVPAHGIMGAAVVSLVAYVLRLLLVVPALRGLMRHPTAA